LTTWETPACRLREIDGRLDQPGLDRPDHVSRGNTFHSRNDRVDVKKIADDDLDPQLFQSRGSIVAAMHHGADIEAEGDGLFRSGTAGVSGRARDQDSSFVD
jgi:hypothetical protein